MHQCSSDCVFTAEKHFNPNQITENPYRLPLMYVFLFLLSMRIFFFFSFESIWSMSRYHWSYFHIDRCLQKHSLKKLSKRPRHVSRTYCLYRSPCGRSFLKLKDIHDYLLTTNSKLTINFFVDDRLIQLQSCLTNSKTHILHRDISQGKERVPITVYSETHSKLPDAFIYGVETRFLSSSLAIEETTNTMCCSCTDKYVIGMFLSILYFYSTICAESIVAVIVVNVLVGLKHLNKRKKTIMNV
jgi:hypothetical protein